jgi:hypothetical protein
MEEQRTRFLSTSEDVYKIPTDMSTLCYLLCGGGEGDEKKVKVRRHAQMHEFDPNFSHRYLSYVINAI